MNTKQALPTGKPRRISVESWMAVIAFTLAALVRAGAFRHLPW